MRRLVWLPLVVVAFGFMMASGSREKGGKAVSFKDDVAPLLQKHCLPCHAEDNFNPSELSLDSYKTLMEGGKHGSPVVPGKGGKSLLVQKLQATPPFGDTMPLDPKRKKGEPSRKKLTEEEIKILREWIDQGAENN